MPPLNSFTQKLFPVSHTHPEPNFRNPTASFNQYHVEIAVKKASKCHSIIAKIFKIITYNLFKITEDTIKKLAIVCITD